MTADILFLPPGTAHTQTVNLPLSGGWCGVTRVGITSTVDCTIHDWTFVWPNGIDGKTWYRRTNITSANNWYNGTLHKEIAQYRWLFENECVMRISYTSTANISLVYDTTRSTLPKKYNNSTIAQWNIASATPWTGTGNNLSANATERSAGDPSILDGVSYWKPVL